VTGGAHRFDVGTAGSLTLLMQAVLPAMVHTPVHTELDLLGGTDVRWSPPVDHLQQVLLPLLRRMGVRVEMMVESRGFYPQGGGRVHLMVDGGALQPLDLRRRGELRRVFGVAFVQNLPERVADHLAEGARRSLPLSDVHVRTEVRAGASIGAGVVLAAEYQDSVLGWSSLGERGVPAERVGKEAALGLIGEMDGGGTLDVHTADQMLPFLALSGGDCTFSVREVSKHLSTQIWLLPHFLPVRFEVGDGAPHQVRVINRT